MVALQSVLPLLLLFALHADILVSSFAFSTIDLTRSFLVRGQQLPLFAVSSAQSTTDEEASGMPESSQLVISLRESLVSTTEDSSSCHDDKIRLILASQSPRRREILDFMGLSGLYQVNPSPLNESVFQQQLQGTDPVEYTRRLAEEKALALARTLVVSSPSAPTRKTTTLVLGSDTIVAHQSHILEKPVDEADAVRMLTKLQGDQHSVHTGVALVAVLENNDSESSNIHVLQSFTDTALVTFSPLSESDIKAYVATGEPMDKAGSYGIQGIGGQIVTSVSGDFFTVRFWWTFLLEFIVRSTCAKF